MAVKKSLGQARRGLRVAHLFLPRPLNNSRRLPPGGYCRLGKAAMNRRTPEAATLAGIIRNPPDDVHITQNICTRRDFDYDNG